MAQRHLGATPLDAAGHLPSDYGSCAVRTAGTLSPSTVYQTGGGRTPARRSASDCRSRASAVQSHTFSVAPARQRALSGAYADAASEQIPPIRTCGRISLAESGAFQAPARHYGRCRHTLVAPGRFTSTPADASFLRLVSRNCNSGRDLHLLNRTQLGCRAADYQRQLRVITTPETRASALR